MQHWLAIAGSNGAPQWLVTQRAVPGHEVLTLAQLLGTAHPAQRVNRWWQPASETLLWSEEGSQWQGGLAVVLGQWLSRGQSLAFAESPGSARRDRTEVAPTGLLLSPQRLQHLANDIESRLAAPGSWRRRLCDWAIADPRSGLRRLIKNRVRRLLGFHRLHYIWQATGPGQNAAAPEWLAQFKRDAA